MNAMKHCLLIVSKTPTSSPLTIEQRPLKRTEYFFLILMTKGRAISRMLTQQTFSCSNSTIEMLKKRCKIS